MKGSSRERAPVYQDRSKTPESLIRLETRMPDPTDSHEQSRLVFVRETFSNSRSNGSHDYGASPIKDRLQPFSRIGTHAEPPGT